MRIKLLITVFLWFGLIQIHGQVAFEDLSVSSRINNPGSNHGVSFGDFNNDGLDDLYIAVREQGFTNRLYKNLGNNRFEDVGLFAGVNSIEASTAAVWGDINNDGLLDLYVGNSDTANQLFLNKGGERFEDITAAAGVGDLADPRSVQFVDVNNDSYLDIYLHNYKTQNVLLLNNQDNTFRDATETSGALNIDQAMGTIFFDMDNDGDLDLYAVNDGESNVMFENIGNGVFEDITDASGLGVQCFCMGVDFGDYDHDGYFDIYISNFGKNYLFRNNGDGTFTDKAADYGVDDPGLGWGTFWFDYDNDGFQDLYLANNFFISSRPNLLYKNQAGSGFVSIGEGSDVDSPYSSFGSAMADVNNDGQMDFAVANWGSFSGNQLFVNRYTDNNAIQIKAIGTVSNFSAIGTTITVKTNDMVQKDQVTAATGYASQNTMTLHFGVGQATTIDEILIKWPSGIEESYADLKVGQLYTIIEDEGIEGRLFSNTIVLNQAIEYTFSSSYPNPFSTYTSIPINTGQDQKVLLEIYTLNGKKVKTLMKDPLENGSSIEWDGTNAQGNRLESGTFVYQWTSEDGTATGSGKLILKR